MAKRIVDGIAIDHESINVNSSSVSSLTASKYFPTDADGIAKLTANRAFITVENGQMRYLTTGNDPTSTTGHLISNGKEFYITGDQNLKNFKVIAVSDRPGILQATYEGVA